MQRWVWLISIFVLAGCAVQSTESDRHPAPIAGQPIKGSGASVYRVMEDGTIQLFPDPTTFFAWGYTWADVVIVDDEALARYPTGPVLSRWVTGTQPSALYVLENGTRYPIPDAATLALTGGEPHFVIPLALDLLNTFPVGDMAFPVDDRAEVTVYDAVTTGDEVWVASTQGVTTATGQAVIDQTTMRALAVDDQTVYAGGAGLWRIEHDQPTLISAAFQYITALAVDEMGLLWVADINHYDFAAGSYHTGQGVVAVDPQTGVVVHQLDTPELGYARALAVDNTQTVWIAVPPGGVFQYDVRRRAWQTPYPANVTRLLADGDQVWLAAGSEIVQVANGTFTSIPLPNGINTPRSLMVTPDTLWIGGRHYLAAYQDGAWQTFQPSQHIAFLDDFSAITPSGNGVRADGNQATLYFVDGNWSYAPRGADHAASFDLDAKAEPVMDAFPDPTLHYDRWLMRWPRPALDDGRCLHYIQSPTENPVEAWRHIAQLQTLGIRWVLVNYQGHQQLANLAPIFAQTDLMVIWRPFVRPAHVYLDWANDIALLRALDLPPYIQIYNEPSHPQEWEGQPVDQALYLEHLVAAYTAVYAAGGFTGLQTLEPDWLVESLHALKAADAPFDRLFFVPHPYGLNHPPDFIEDRHGVLGFRAFADIFADELGFVPVMIAGEGGWRLGEQQDTRFPPVDEVQHRDYHVAVFEWFRRGTLSDGEPLPDYLFAFCPWLLSDPTDRAAWFDHPDGDLTLTIEAVAQMPQFDRAP